MIIPLVGGLWLQQAGFAPHQVYTLTIHDKGTITLQTETARLALHDGRPTMGEGPQGPPPSGLQTEPYETLYCEHDHPTPAHPDYPDYGQCPECAYWEQVDYEYDRWRDK